MYPWLQIVRIYRNPQIFSIFLLGFSSGLPFLLTLGTLQAWLTEAGVTKTIIGLFALTTIPYAFKFLWAPLIDQLHLPYLSKILGVRRSWMLLSQGALMAALIGLGLTRPTENIYITALFAFLVSFTAASQDIVIEAYRVESLSDQYVGPGASASVLGFRIGMWVSGGGALYLAAHLQNWMLVYTLMALCVSIGMMATLLSPEPPPLFKEPLATLKRQSTNGLFLMKFREALTSFFTRDEWYLILIFIVCFKVGDTTLNMMSIPFLLEIGFSTVEIAHIAKSFGIFAMVIGGLLGGAFLVSLRITLTLLICAALQLISCIMFMIQAYAGHDIGLLILTMGIENLTCGMSAAALIAFLSQLCQRPYTATHYALLSSFGSFVRLSLSIAAGWLSDQTTWVNFYALITLGCVPCLLLLFSYPMRLILSTRRPSFLLS